MAERQGLPKHTNINPLSQWSANKGLWAKSNWWPVFGQLQAKHGFDIFKGLLKKKKKKKRRRRICNRDTCDLQFSMWLL